MVVHADTTPANVHEAMRTALIHDALAAKGLAPSELLVDSAYVSADDLIMAHEQYGIDLVGPARPDQSWQSRAEAAFSAADFAVDWDRRVARCPEGKESTGWFESARERQAPGPAELDPGPVPSRRLSRLRVPDPLHPGAFGPPRSRARPSAEARIRGPRCGPGPREHGGRPAPLRATPRRGKHAVPRRAGLRPAPDALSRPGQDAPAARRYGCGPQSRPCCCLVRGPPTRAHSHLALCCTRGVTDQFANGVRSFSGRR